MRTEAEELDYYASLCSIDPVIARETPIRLADRVSRGMRKYYEELSPLELTSLLVPVSWYLDSTGFPKERCLANLCDYMETYCIVKGESSIDHLRSSVEAPGRPHTLIITPSTIRCADVLRTLRPRYETPTSAMGKFFNQDMLLIPSMDWAVKTRIGIGVCTPSRCLEMLMSNCMKADNLYRVIIDASYLDHKKAGVFDHKEVLERIMMVFHTKGVPDRLKDRGEQGKPRGILWF